MAAGHSQEEREQLEIVMHICTNDTGKTKNEVLQSEYKKVVRKQNFKCGHL